MQLRKLETGPSRIELEFHPDFWMNAEFEGDRVYLKYRLDLEMQLYCNGWEL